MKPKHRTTLYVVVRHNLLYEDLDCVLDSFHTYERADEIRQGYKQTMKERNIDFFEFNIFPSTYYDE